MKEHINLIIDERTTPRGERKLALESMVLPGLIVALLLVLGFSYTWQAKRAARVEALVRNLQVQRDGLKANLDQLSRSPGHAENPMPNTSSADLLGPRTDWAGVIREISWVVPEGVYLMGMDSRRDGREGEASNSVPTIKFTGNATSHGAIARFLSQLEGSGRFEHVALVFADKKSGASGGLIGFEITGELRVGAIRG